MKTMLCIFVSSFVVLLILGFDAAVLFYCLKLLNSDVTCFQCLAGACFFYVALNFHNNEKMMTDVLYKLLTTGRL